jgi:hypothetical protein
MLILTLRKLLGAKRKEAPFPVTLPGIAADPPERDLIFRLKAWPELPEDGRTADVYRILSVMSSQPVNRRWLLETGRMAPRQLDRLLAQLVQAGVLEVIDPARFGRKERARA